jgi:Histidine kinase
LLLLALEVTNLIFYQSILGFNRLTTEQSTMIYLANTVSSVGVVGYFLYLIMKTNAERELLLNIQQGEQEKIIQSERQRADIQSVLVAEMHHRLKNNLSVIQGIMSFKQHHIGERKNDEIFNDTIQAIRTIAIAHNIQVVKEEAVYVPFQVFANEIADNRQLDFPVFERKETKFENEIFLDLKDAIPFGLILDEVLSILAQISANNNFESKIEFNSASYEETLMIQIICAPSKLSQFKKMLERSYIHDLSEQINAQVKITEKGEETVDFSLLYAIKSTKLIDSDHL